MNKNLCLNDSEKDWLLKVRSILSKPQPEVEEQPIPIPTPPPNDEIWYTSSDGNIIRPASGLNIDEETEEVTIIFDGPYNDVFGADIISNTYENGKGIIKFDGNVTKLGLPSGDFISASVFSDYSVPSPEIPRLTSINLPNSVTSIGSNAFYMCTGLTSITISGSITEIGSDAFNGVLNVNYNGTATGSPWGARYINGYIENDIVYTDNTKTQLVGISKLYSGSINIPNSVTNISNYAFQECTGLTSITIPNSVTNISNYVFQGCTGLTSITIPNSVTDIGDNVFQGCTGLTSITIPNSVTDIGDCAFLDCTSLTSITSLNTTPPTLGGEETFDYTNDCPIYVPSESVDTYKSSWSTYTDRIQAIQ